jgi:hypothetical protein
VMRPGQRLPGHPVAAREPRGPQSSRLRNVITLLAVAGLGAFGYSEYTKRVTPRNSLSSGISMPVVPASSPYTCDGRTRCPQMSSCDEATYFINHCPNTTMDGDGDGVPCESQWCN